MTDQIIDLHYTLHIHLVEGEKPLEAPKTQIIILDLVHSGLKIKIKAKCSCIPTHLHC